MEDRQRTGAKSSQPPQPKLAASYGSGNRTWSGMKRGPGRSPKDSRHNQKRKYNLRLARRRGQMQ